MRQIGLAAAALLTITLTPCSISHAAYTINAHTGQLDYYEPGASVGSSISGGTPNRVLYIDSSGNLADDADLTFDGTQTLTATKITTTSLTDSGLTSGRIPYVTTGGLLTDDADMTFDGTNLATITSIRSDSGIGVGIAPSSSVAFNVSKSFSGFGGGGYTGLYTLLSTSKVAQTLLGMDYALNASGTNEILYGMRSSLMLDTGSSGGLAYGYFAQVNANNSATSSQLYGSYLSVNPSRNDMLGYGSYISGSGNSTDPTVDQIGLYLTWGVGGAGTDANNKKWSLYNASSFPNAGKIFLGLNNVKTYWGTSFTTTAYDNGTNFLLERSSGSISLGSTPFITTGTATAANFISTVATGTQPYAATSTTLNTNLNADMVDGVGFSTMTGGRVPYMSSSSLVADAAGFTFDGTTLTVGGLTTTGNITIDSDASALILGDGQDGKLIHNGSGIVLQSDVVTAGDYLQLRGGTNGIDFNIGATEQITLTDGKLAPTTTLDIDLGDNTHVFNNAYVNKYLFPKFSTTSQWEISRNNIDGRLEIYDNIHETWVLIAYPTGAINFYANGGDITFFSFGSGSDIYLVPNDGSGVVFSESSEFQMTGKMKVGAETSPGARVDIVAGSTSVGPLKFNSGTNLTSPVAGMVEFTTDDLFFTITTGTARKAFILDDGARLTSGTIPVATTNGRLINSTALSTSGTITSSRTSDVGWSIQTGANTACNTTCTSACVHGWDTASGEVAVACTDATADKCLCAGAS